MYTIGMPIPSRPTIPGRGAAIAPPIRFERLELEDDWEQLEQSDVPTGNRIARTSTEYFLDQSQSIISENSSPDIPFRYSINPYRGCQHGCVYCYARPTHEYLGMNAGVEFESKILVKPYAADLFRKWLARKNYVPENVVFSGVTDCYQPVESRMKLTRQCLEVAVEARQPIGIVTKNALVSRDIDLLAQMAARETVAVAVSVTSLDQSLTCVLEPRTSSPAARLRAIEQLSAAGVPTHVMVAPVIPGLNDNEIPAILSAARDAGAVSASYVLLRLPLAVKPIFLDWLKRHRPLSKRKIESLIVATRDGKLNDSRYGRRMAGSGPIAEQVRQTFDVFAKKFRLARRMPPLETRHFRSPRLDRDQLLLFND